MRHKNSSRQLTKTHNGFTMIELLVVISIAAIIITIAGPNFSQMVSKQSVKAAANDFKSAVALARSEARKRGVKTSIRPIGKTGSPWGTVDNGWHIYYNDGGTMKTVLEHQLESGSIQVSGNKVGFDLLGGTGRLGVGVEGIICFEDSNNTSNVPAYIVSVNQAGFVVVTESASCPA
tara:strand:- start:182 stop:712 length:531 start_codon:yes stop_codon:yes gene_type:complete